MKTEEMLGSLEVEADHVGFCAPGVTEQNLEPRLKHRLPSSGAFLYAP